MAHFDPTPSKKKPDVPLTPDELARARANYDGWQNWATINTTAGSWHVASRPPWDLIELEKEPQQTRVLLRLALQHNLNIPWQEALHHAWEGATPTRLAINAAIRRVNDFLVRFGFRMRRTDDGGLLISPSEPEQRD